MVSDLSLDQVLELLDIRIALECRALRLAIPNMIDVDFETAANILRSYDAEPDSQRWSDMNWAFHEALYIPCGRAKLLAMISANYGHLGRFIRAWVSRAAGKDRPQREHYALLRCCQSSDVERAVHILEAHISQTQKSLIAAERQRSKSQRISR